MFRMVKLSVIKKLLVYSAHVLSPIALHYNGYSFYLFKNIMPYSEMQVPIDSYILQ